MLLLFFSVCHHHHPPSSKKATTRPAFPQGTQSKECSIERDMHTMEWVQCTTIGLDGQQQQLSISHRGLRHMVYGHARRVDLHCLYPFAIPHQRRVCLLGSVRFLFFSSVCCVFVRLFVCVCVVRCTPLVCPERTGQNGSFDSSSSFIEQSTAAEKKRETADVPHGHGGAVQVIDHVSIK
jgi:hypothetical protein